MVPHEHGGLVGSHPSQAHGHAETVHQGAQDLVAVLSCCDHDVDLAVDGNGRRGCSMTAFNTSEGTKPWFAMANRWWTGPPSSSSSSTAASEGRCAVAGAPMESRHHTSSSAT